MLVYELKSKLIFNNKTRKYRKNKIIFKQLNLTDQEAFDLLYPDKIKYCPICGKKCAFSTFRRGYNISCKNKEHTNKIRFEHTLKTVQKIYRVQTPLDINNGRLKGI